MKIDIELELDKSCWSCAGVGAPYSAKPDGTCSECNGSKLVVTDQGQIVLNFLARHFGVAK